jgi:carbon-monoxide dehydrogenase iron sulfur subunit
MKEVFIDVERCMGCKSCEIACAVGHSISKDLFGALLEKPVPRKRIHVEKALQFSYPARCMHCSDAACITACPSGAMHRDADTGGVALNEDRCMGCWMCAMVCSFGAISAAPDKKTVLKCDLCKSRLAEGKPPACVESCPTKALLFIEPDELSKGKRLIIARAVAAAVGRTTEEETTVSPLEILRQSGGF